VRTVTWITDFGHAWTWVGFGAWLHALVGPLRHGLRVLRGQPGSAAAQDRA